MLTINVSQLNRYVKAILEENDKLGDLYIKAEISNFKYHTVSGHMYFSLKDDKAVVRGVMFRSYAQSLQFMPENGMAVIVRGSVSIFEQSGDFQVYVTDIQPDGVGAMSVAARQLRDRLEEQGLFDSKYKKALPKYPSTIGVITASTGAAIGDITQVLSRRYPIGTMVFHPAIVQGREAVTSLIYALENLDGSCDVIIIGRGGGSDEDLAAFQDEMLARAIFSAKTPIISAVGHEMDVTICDMVADMRAATPTAAAELATPSVDELKEQFNIIKTYIATNAYMLVKNDRYNVRKIAEHPIFKRPAYALERKKEQLDFLVKRVYNVMESDLNQKKNNLSKIAALLESLSPVAVMGRGYSLAYKNEKIIRSVKEVSVGDDLELKLGNGQINVLVKEVKEGEL